MTLAGPKDRASSLHGAHLGRRLLVADPVCLFHAKLSQAGICYEHFGLEPPA